MRIPCSINQKQMKKNACILLLVAIMIAACQKNRQNNPVNLSSLEGELLHHYARPSDSLKRKAAIFLINNMRLHYEDFHPVSRVYNPIFKQLDTLYHLQTEVSYEEMKSVVESALPVRKKKIVGYKNKVES